MDVSHPQAPTTEMTQVPTGQKAGCVPAPIRTQMLTEKEIYSPRNRISGVEPSVSHYNDINAGFLTECDRPRASVGEMEGCVEGEETN
jgi:hypothetical protein